MEVGITVDPTTVTEARTPRQMLTVEQAAAALGIGRTTMFALIKAREIETVRIGRLRRVPADAIDTYTDRLITEQTTDGA
jgi:excisionase family DNA binding protein